MTRLYPALERQLARKMGLGSDPEESLAAQMRLRGLPEPVRELRFAPPRRWRFDFAWPDRKLAVEVEGGLHSRGRHVRPAGFTKDAEKYNQAARMGWAVLRFVVSMVEDGSAVTAIAGVLGARTQEAEA